MAPPVLPGEETFSCNRGLQKAHDGGRVTVLGSTSISALLSYPWHSRGVQPLLQPLRPKMHLGEGFFNSRNSFTFPLEQ